MTAVAETPVERLNFWRRKRAERERDLREAKGHWFASCTKANQRRYDMAKSALARADEKVRECEQAAREDRPRPKGYVFQVVS